MTRPVSEYGRVTVFVKSTDYGKWEVDLYKETTEESLEERL